MKSATRFVVVVTLMNTLSYTVRAEMESFIVGGAYTNIQKFPHSAFLEVNCTTRWICGSALLNQRILLTAAHCVVGCTFDEEYPDTIVALLGHANLKMVSVKRKVVNVVCHKFYDEISMANDIALAMLKRNVPLGFNMKRVVITEEFPIISDNQLGFVAGWGVISDQKDAVSSMHLKYVSQKVKTRNKCVEVGRMHRGMFCAGSTDNGADHPSQGDSGSAMVTGGYHQIGLVSFCLRKYRALSVYTNVSFYYQWILKNAKKMYCGY